MTTSDEINHLVKIEKNSEGYDAFCSCGHWFVIGCDTKQDAIDLHDDHEAGEYER